MEALFVDQEYSHLRIPELLRIVERPHFNTDEGTTRNAREDVSAAIRAELASRGRSKSLRVNCLGVPFVYLNPATGIAMTTLGAPPQMYWHSRQ